MAESVVVYRCPECRCFAGMQPIAPKGCAHTGCPAGHAPHIGQSFEWERIEVVPAARLHAVEAAGERLRDALVTLSDATLLALETVESLMMGNGSRGVTRLELVKAANGAANKRDEALANWNDLLADPNQKGEG
jgi:hypothetical protein